MRKTENIEKTENKEDIENLKCEIDIVKSVNIERYTTTNIYLFISTPGACHVMLV